jgi:hypothetical protein
MMPKVLPSGHDRPVDAHAAFSRLGQPVVRPRHARIGDLPVEDLVELPRPGYIIRGDLEVHDPAHFARPPNPPSPPAIDQRPPRPGSGNKHPTAA